MVIGTMRVEIKYNQSIGKGNSNWFESIKKAPLITELLNKLLKKKKLFID